jgi:hypothetical protein
MPSRTNKPTNHVAVIVFIVLIGMAVYFSLGDSIKNAQPPTPTPTPEGGWRVIIEADEEIITGGTLRWARTDDLDVARYRFQISREFVPSGSSCGPYGGSRAYVPIGVYEYSVAVIEISTENVFAEGRIASNQEVEEFECPNVISSGAGGLVQGRTLQDCDFEYWYASVMNVEIPPIPTLPPGNRRGSTVCPPESPRMYIVIE